MPSGMAKADHMKSAFRRCLSTINPLKLCTIYTSAPRGALEYAISGIVEAMP